MNYKITDNENCVKKVIISGYNRTVAPAGVTNYRPCI